MFLSGEAEIVSVDAFTGNGLIIGITFWKVEYQLETKYIYKSYIVELFYGPVNAVKVMLSWSVKLFTFPGQV